MGNSLMAWFLANIGWIGLGFVFFLILSFLISWMRGGKSYQPKKPTREPSIFGRVPIPPPSSRKEPQRTPPKTVAISVCGYCGVKLTNGKCEDGCGGTQQEFRPYAVFKLPEGGNTYK